MVYPEELVDKLKMHINDYNYMGSPEFGKLHSNSIVISNHNISELIKISFFTSMLTEEGNYLHFRIVYSGSSDFDTLLGFRIDEFETMLPLDVETTIKLANTFDFKRSAIAVVEIDQKLCIKGILHYGYDLYNYTIKKHINPLFAHIPEHLIITVSDVASLNISIGMNPLLAYKKGVITEVLKKKRISEPMLSDTIDDFFDSIVDKKYKDEKDLKNYFRQLYDNKLIYLMNRVNDFKLGGLVIISEAATELDIVHALQKRSFSKATAIQLLDSKITMLNQGRNDLFEVYPEFFQKTLPPSELKLLNYFDTIAYYTRSDGALILNREFDVIGFGAKITSPPAQTTLVNGYDGKAVKARTFKEFMLNRGTRHKSAFNYVAAHNNTIAFVFSQDQKITIFKKTINKVFFYKDVQLYLDKL